MPIKRIKRKRIEMIKINPLDPGLCASNVWKRYRDKKAVKIKIKKTPSFTQAAAFRRLPASRYLE